jgi:hypothetical protein
MSGVISSSDAESLSKIGTAGIWFFAFFYALFSSLACSLLGALMAVVYNLVAKNFGGLEFTLDPDSIAPVARADDHEEWQNHE